MHGDGIGYLALDVVHLAVEGGELSVDGSHSLPYEVGEILVLAALRNLATEDGVLGTCRVEFVLQGLRGHLVEFGEDGLRVAVVSVRQCVGLLAVGEFLCGLGSGDVGIDACKAVLHGCRLLHSAHLALVALLGHQQLVLAAAVGELCGEVLVAGHDGIDNLQWRGGVLDGHIVEDAVDCSELRAHRGEVLSEHGADGLYGLTALLAVGADGGTQQFGVAVCRSLCAESGRGTVAVTTKTAIVANPVAQRAAEEAADASAPEIAAAETAKTAVACKQPRPCVVHIS